MKEYIITIYYNGAEFIYHIQTDVENFPEKIDNGQLENQGFTTLRVHDDHHQECVIHLNPANCGHIKIKEVKYGLKNE